MTIGIAIRGPGAGFAAFRALLGAELLGRGAIAGFCVFAWRDAFGRIRYETTQNGGTSGLTLSGDWAEAGHAALISSGPDRPEPLTQFLPADDDAGFVTGHRLPASHLPTGEPINGHALDLMRRGSLTQARLERLLADGAAMDAGLICLPLEGPCLLANAPRVETRDDLGRFVVNDGRYCCAILHNSIYAAVAHGDALAADLGGIAAETMGRGPARLGLLTLPDRLPVTASDHEALVLDEAGKVVELRSADPAYGESRARITAVYSRIPVVQGGRRIGEAATEVFAGLEPYLLLPGPAAAERSFLYLRH